MFDVLFTETALKQLKKLDREIQRRIMSTIERVRIRPEDFVKRLVGEPYFRLRAGDYRVILDIKRDRMIIMVLYVGHRKNIYERYTGR